MVVCVCAFVKCRLKRTGLWSHLLEIRGLQCHFVSFRASNGRLHLVANVGKIPLADAMLIEDPSDPGTTDDDGKDLRDPSSGPGWSMPVFIVTRRFVRPRDTCPPMRLPHCHVVVMSIRGRIDHPFLAGHALCHSLT